MGTFHDRQRLNSGRLGRDFATDSFVVVGVGADSILLDFAQLGDDYKRRERDGEYESERVYVRHMRISVDPANDWFSGVTRVKDDTEISVIDNDCISTYVVESVRTAESKFQEIKMERASRVSYGGKVSGQ